MSPCPEYDRLASQAEETLKRLAETATLQLEIFRSKSPPSSRVWTRNFELLVGEKERSIARCDSMRLSTSVRWRSQAFSTSG
jgi:hypothetical protein